MSGTQPSFPIPTTAKIQGIDEERGRGLPARTFGNDRTKSAASQTRFANDHFGLFSRNPRGNTANPTTQWGRNLSPLKVSAKREFPRFGPETFGRFSLKLRFSGDGRLTRNARNAYKTRGFRTQRACYLWLREWLAALGGIELGHSRLNICL